MKIPFPPVRRIEQAAALSPFAATAWLAFTPLPAHAALTEISPAPLANSSTAVVLPNILFILDNSGSMDRDFMPDYVTSNFCKDNSSTSGTLDNCQYGDPAYHANIFNGLAYNPTVTYKPAVNADTSSRTSYNTPALWAAVPNDAYGIQFTGSVDLTQNYPDIVWCNSTSPSSSDRTPPYLSGACQHPLALGTNAWTTPNGTYISRQNVNNGSAPFIRAPFYYSSASLQWCSNKDANGFGAAPCQSKKTATYRYPAYGTFTRTDIVASEITTRFATTTVTHTACGEGLADNCCGNISGGTFRNVRERTLVQNRDIVTRGARVVSDSTTTVSDNTVLRLGACVLQGNALLNLPSPNPAVSTTSTQLSSTALSYPKTTSRTDCTGAVGATGCSFTEEMTNFANWYAYYRTRMQAMKTGAGLAFKTLNQNYRVGFLTIQPLSGPSVDQSVQSGHFLANAPFEGAQRTSWYQKFYDTNPTSFTPLREALARAGRYYAGMGPGDTSASSGINRGMNHDPIQYSCQQNFSILSTDGLWNTNDETRGPVSINNTTLVANPDSIIASAPRPMYDGSNAETTTTTTTATTTQAVCTGSAGVLGTSCGCPANLKRIKQQVVNNVSTAVTKGGSTTTTNSSNTVYSNPYPADGTCDALQVGTLTPQTAVQIRWCVDNTGTSNATFTDGATINCDPCNSGRGFLVRQTKNQTKSEISYDGGPVVTGTTVNSTNYEYSTNGTSWGSTAPTGGSCTSTNLSGNATGVIVTDGTPVTPVNTGSTVSAANFTIPGGGPASTTTTATSTVSGTSNTLADVAQYYYITDLRGGKDAFGNNTGPATSPSTVPAAGGDVSENNVKGQAATDVQNDSATWQHMTTFTLGLGVDGTLTYAPDYKTNPTGDFLLIKNGTADWPAPVADSDTAVDDLWHAAVNGRGKYLSARDPGTLSSGLSEALSSVNAVVGAAAAAATSNLEPVAGDNFAYIASYETVRWNGEVEARTIDLNTGAVSSTNVWSAKAQLDTLTTSASPGGSTRKIWRRNPGATDGGTGSNLEDFLYSKLDPTTEQIYFQEAHLSGGSGALYPALTQWASLDPTTQHPIAQGENLVNFLRGDGAFENNSTVPATNRVFRDRVSVLGDVVNAQPVFVKKSSLGYVDVGYAAFKSCLNDGGTAGSCDAITGTDVARPSTVYISSNDGMLHAFNGDTGAERWAFIPNILLPKLYRLADSDYGTAANHQWMVDGSPIVGDIHDGTKWRTLLVGGLNSGGRGYYALDVTDPAKPKALWEFNVRSAGACPSAAVAGDIDDCDLGLTYGNPVISKLGNGDWVVMFASGYNNVNPGDGKGYLYVVNPLDGKLIRKIALANADQGLDPGPGDTTTPLGFAKINNWVDDTNVNNTTLRVYGGDLLGNVWRINADDGTAYVVAKLTDTSGPPPTAGAPQPITTKFELGQVTGASGTADMIYVGTGKYLGAGDVASTQVQTIYGIKDATNGIAPPTPVNARGNSVVAQTLTDTTDATGAAVRTVTSNPVSVTTAGVDGWRVDLPITGERVNIDMRLQLGTLIVGSNIPANNACNAGGFSFLNFFDYRTGSYIPSAGGNIAGQRVGNSLLVGINVVRLPNNKTVAIATTSDNQHPTLYPPFQSPNPVGRRVGWTEIAP